MIFKLRLLYLLHYFLRKAGLEGRITAGSDHTDFFLFQKKNIMHKCKIKLKNIVLLPYKQN